MEPNEGGNELPTQPNPPNPPQNPPQPPYDYLSVHPFKIKYSDGQQKPYKPMRILVVTRFFEKFSLPNGMDPTVQVISELFLPDLFLAKVAKCSNLYGKALIQAHFHFQHFGLLQHHLLHGNCPTSSKD